MKKVRFLIFSLVLLSLLTFTGALAQDYSFNLQEGVVDVFLNGDGTARIEYAFTFNNDPGASPIEFVDVAFPSYTDVDVSSITATVGDQPVEYISSGEYQGDGSGVAVALGAASIPPGATGTVHVNIGNVKGLIFQDSQDANLASFEFSPDYFTTAHGTTKWTVNFHLPPGVTPEEPRWHASPNGWPAQPETYLDQDGRVTYTWTNEAAQGDKEYKFGASFPIKYLPAGIVRQPDVAQSLGTDWGSLTNIGMWTCCIGIFAIIILVSYRNGQRRKLQYLPPKIAIEGHGIKRGLSAVEAALLLEQPLDKILTMILFGVVKKGAASVKSKDPLELTITEPLPEGLQPYENDFINSFKAPTQERKKALQAMMIDLVNSLATKMKGFSRKETIAYYKDIVQRAWAQVETAGTPEVKSEKFDENLEWTMMDEKYDDRTRRVFGPGPVFVPTWWPRYDPGYGGSTPSGPSSVPGGSPIGGSGGGGLTMPTLPGSAFAGSIVTGVQNFSSKVVGNISEFTGAVTNKTNPVPVTTSTRSGGGTSHSGGCACACACACAGCACACAGGGR
jgi:hypothetical protein